MSAFLAGKHQPQTNGERLALLGVCQSTNRTSALARLYADAFAAVPQLAKDVGAGHRYVAARAAALAGSGHGEDVGRLSQKERTHWRRKGAWPNSTSRPGPGRWPAVSRGSSPGYADLGSLVGRSGMGGLRDRVLEKFSVEERGVWLALWK